ncbi:hypothetical protein BDA99DRAFT_516857 [Phascolomyces articulosus]|uniref:Uncharacterized protein n=1 Tax=Phascolomyces articulosus TaxID=60185 RepID=A0AAD5K5U0_9FUNG|nr:hypothetical protein BDA99DRAFT_516857 [Phascolomyces articulosus]
MIGLFKMIQRRRTSMLFIASNMLLTQKSLTGQTRPRCLDMLINRCQSIGHFGIINMHLLMLLKNTPKCFLFGLDVPDTLFQL